MVWLQEVMERKNEREKEIGCITVGEVKCLEEACLLSFACCVALAVLSFSRKSKMKLNLCVEDERILQRERERA